MCGLYFICQFHSELQIPLQKGEKWSILGLPQKWWSLPSPPNSCPEPSWDLGRERVMCWLCLRGVRCCGWERGLCVQTQGCSVTDPGGWPGISGGSTPVSSQAREEEASGAAIQSGGCGRGHDKRSWLPLGLCLDESDVGWVEVFALGVLLQQGYLWFKTAWGVCVCVCVCVI